jgi:hypothetical protein
MKPIRTLFVAVLVLAVTAPANAQFGSIKKKLKEKAAQAGVEKVVGSEEKSSAPAKTTYPQWKEGEVERFTAADFDKFIAMWKTELAETQAQRDEMDRQAQLKQKRSEALKAKWDTCSKNAVTLEQYMEVQQKYNAEIQAAAEKSAATNNPAEFTKVTLSVQEKIDKDIKVLQEKKCGLEPKIEYAQRSGTFASFRMKERLQAYLTVRAHQGAAAAAAVVLANDVEAKILEARADEVQQLFNGELKPAKR